MACTIYDDGIWQRIIEKHNLKELAIKLDVYQNPQKAREMVKTFEHSFGDGKLSKTQKDFCTHLIAVEFVEQNLLEMLVVTGSQHYSVGAGDYVKASMHLVLEDFERSFEDFLYECKKRGKKIDNIKFAEAYEIFLYVIKLKIKYQIPYTKLFVRKLISLSPECFKKEDSIEIKEYFLEHNQRMLPEIQDELIL